MATELAMAMRRLKAQEEQARQLADLNRKMDLVMAQLKATGLLVEVQANEQPPAAETSEVKEGDPPAAVSETKSKKKK